MRCGGWMTSLVLGGWMVTSLGGCVSLNQYRGLQAQHRTVIAEKEQISQELFDARSLNDSLRHRATSLERELADKDELVVNLRSENQLLDDMRRMLEGEIEGLANRQTASTIQIAAPKLPASLDSALKRFADEHPTAVAYDPVRGTVKWKSDLLFALGSDVVKQSTMESLSSFCEILKSPAAADFEVIVVGHTDNRPISKPKTKEQHPTNWHLSAHRAIAVSSVLRKDGYSPQRIGVMGYGEYRPIADNSTQAGASQNRRVEIYLVPAGTIAPTTADAGAPDAGVAFARVTE